MNDEIVESFSRKSLGWGLAGPLPIYLNAAGTHVSRSSCAPQNAARRENRKAWLHPGIGLPVKTIAGNPRFLRGQQDQAALRPEWEHL
jgi:hypothetical protein